LTFLSLPSAKLFVPANPEVTRRVIAEHERVMRSRLDDLSILVSELQQAANEPTLQTPAFVRSTPAQHALAIARTIDDPGHDAYAAFFEIAFRQLAEAFGRLRCQPVGRPAHCIRQRLRVTAK
jgi:hypothetical protein